MGLLFASFFCACVIVFPIYLVSCAIASSKKRQEKFKEIAFKKGHVVTATRIKKSSYIADVPGTNRNISKLGVYEYRYNGKKYKYRLWAFDPPQTLTLYFDKNPRKATLDGALHYSKVSWPLAYVCVTAVIYILIRIVLAL